MGVPALMILTDDIRLAMMMLYSSYLLFILFNLSRRNTAKTVYLCNMCVHESY